jgi:hemolysin activation/secretion protein
MIKMTSRPFQATVCLGALGLFLAGPVHGQAIERHAPEVPQNSRDGVIVGPNVLPTDQDDRPIGPPLRAIRLLGSTEAVAAGTPDGVSVGAVERLADENARAAMTVALASFLNRPISHKLIAEIEATIASNYRDLDHPFVSLSTPEQEIGGGLLQIRVIEFKLGNVSVHGDIRENPETIVDRLDMMAGQPINTRDLSRKLNWVNRYPFRRLQAVFAPGSELGSTDLDLQAVQTKPWQAYAGYTNDGTRATSYDRFYIGGAAGGLLFDDSVTAAQITISPDAISDRHFPRYESAALTYTVPAGPGNIETTFDRIRTYQSAQDFVSGTNVVEGRLGYRLPLAWKALGEADANIRFGVEANRQTRKIYFTGTKVYQVGMDVGQIYLGLQQIDQTWGNWDIALHVSPGGLSARNSDARVEFYSLGRMKNASYAYLTVDYDNQADLGFGQWGIEFSGQYSPDVLPFTAQSGLGGMALVRGYSLENGAFDTSVTLRNELRFKPHVEKSGSTAPYLFADLGWGRDNYDRRDQKAASVGIGLRARALDHISVNALGGAALVKNANIDSGDLFARINISFDL